MNKKSKTILSILIFAIILLLVIDPKNNTDAIIQGILLWANAVLPALFPFFFLTSILMSLKVIEKLGKLFSPITKKLFKTPGISGYVYVMSIISGYPVGAKITADLYENGIITQGQAFKITTFTSTSGPLFIVGTVGLKMFHNIQLGYLILLAHVLGALINGIFYRNALLGSSQIKILLFSQSKENALEDSMYSSIKSVMIVGGYVAIFYMIITMLNNYNIITPFSEFISLVTHSSPLFSKGVINGLIEVTRGCKDISLLGLTKKQALVTCTGLISFGGLSIFLQAYTFLKRFNISLKFYFLSKLTQTIFSVVIALIICLII